MRQIHLYTGWWENADADDQRYVKEAVQQGLQDGLVKLTFTKADGTIREMAASQNSQFVPPAPVTEATKAPRAPNPELCHVWDTKAEGWRSFRWDRLLAMAILPASAKPE